MLVIQQLEDRRYLTINADLTGFGNVEILAADSGNFADTVELSLVAGGTLRVFSPEGVAAGNGFTSVNANSATIPLADITGGGIQVETFDGADLIVVRATAVGTITTVLTGAGNDEIQIQSATTTLDEIRGTVFLAGGAADAGQSSLTIRGEVNALPSGDLLTISDAGSVTDQAYTLSDTQFQRTTPAAPSAVIQYGGIETLNLRTTSARATATITDTAAGVNTNLTTQDAADQVNVLRSGDDSNLQLVTAGGADTVELQTTGTDGGAGAVGRGSFVVAQTGAGSDQFTLHNSGQASRVQWDAGDDADSGLLQGSATDSVMDVLGGGGSDTFHLASDAPSDVGTLDGLQGAVFLAGGAADAGQSSLTIRGEVNALPSGDLLTISDAGSVTDQAYTLSDTQFQRTTPAAPSAVIQYGGIETLNLRTTSARATATITDTAAGVNTNLTTQDAADQVNVLRSGDDSNLQLVTAGGADTVELQTTGTDGGAGAVGRGSFVVAQTGAGSDQFTLHNSGQASRVQWDAGDDADSGLLQGSATDSVMDVLGGGGSDTFHLASDAPSDVGTLDGLQGAVFLAGGAADAGQSSLTIRGEVNALPSGDLLTISDAGSVTDQAYTLSDTQFQRTTPAAPSAVIQYGGIETLNLRTTSARATATITDTAAGVNTNLTTQDAADQVNVLRSGDDSNLQLVTAGGADTVELQTTGTDGGAGAVGRGSFVVAQTGAGSDQFTLHNSGQASRVQWDAGDDADSGLLQGSATDSVMDVLGGGGSDTFHLASDAPSDVGTLDGLQGAVFLAGGAADAGQSSLTIRGEVNALPSGDLLTISDAGSVTDQAYTLSDTQFQRTTPAAPSAVIQYGGIETLNLRTTSARATATITDTAAGVNTNLTTQDAADQVNVLRSGDDSNLQLVTAGGADTVELQTTGTDGGAGAVGRGSFVVAQTGAGSDQFTLHNSGQASRVQWDAGDDADSGLLQGSATDSVMDVLGGGGSDTFHLASDAPSDVGTLDGLQGAVFLAGGAADAGQSSLTIRGEVNALPSGDLLTISDAGSVTDQAYTLSDTQFQRTTPAAPSAVIQYGGIETLNLRTTSARATATITDTAAGVNTNLTTQDAADQVNVLRSGDDSNLQLVTAGGADTVELQTTGTDGGAGAVGRGSFVVAQTGAGSDQFTLHNSGQASRVQWDAGDDADSGLLQGSATDSVMDVLGGGGDDTITLGSVGQTVDGLVGALFVNGGTHDAGGRVVQVGASVEPGVPYGPSSTYMMDPPSPGDHGDTLSILDGLDDDGNTYTINASVLTRATQLNVEYEQIETVEITAGGGNDQLTVLLPQIPSVITFDGGSHQAGIDQLLVVGNEQSNETRIGIRTTDPNVRAMQKSKTSSSFHAWGRRRRCAGQRHDNACVAAGRKR